MTSTSEPTRTQLILLLLAGVLSVSLLLFSVWGDRTQGELSAGEPSPVSFAAPVDLQVIDEIATSQQRQTVRQQIDDIYNVDAQAQQHVMAALTAAALPESVRAQLIEAYSQPDGVTAEALPALVEAALESLPADEADGLRPVLFRRLLPTSVPNPELTEAARAAAANAVRPVMEFVRAGQLIVREGDILTANQLGLLQATGLYDVRADEFRQVTWIVAGCVMLGVLFSLALVLVWRFTAGQVSVRQFVFLAAMTFLVLAAQRYALGLSQNFLFVLLVPLLVSVLINWGVGLFWGIWSTALLALLVPAGPEYALAAGLTGTAVVVWLAPLQRNRPSLLLAGALSGAAAALALVATALLMGGYTVVAVVLSAAWLIAGGALAGLLSLALLPLAENQFDFLTDFRLLELSNPATPLLQRLLLEAPGTYQHSLVISNLVQQAVQAIGGNAMLARVGALYHDVGKLKRPSFFVENQFSGENPHDRLSPHLSYLIITAHVRDGVELLREHRMPKELERFVLEHHGTTILSYFYKRALEATPSLDELNFRYPGPKPQSRETAVLMLADAVESASRTIGEASQGDIRALIDRLFEQRLRDGQLAESDLNFDDLEKIRSTFERLLSAILHRRVSYPTPEEIGRLKRGQPSGGEPVAATVQAGAPLAQRGDS